MSTVKHMRRMNDFRPVHAVIDLINDMPMPEAAELRQIVAALSGRLFAEDAKRFDAVLDALRDVDFTLEDCEPASSECDGCAGSGISRHNGSGCISCGGRGEAAA